MTRLLVLAASVLALAGSASSSFHQRGTVETPRAAEFDGQPMAGKARFSAHASTTASSALETPGVGRDITWDDNAAAVARNQAGGSLRIHGPGVADFNFEVDGAWSPTPAATSGAPIDAPRDAVVNVTTGLRIPVQVDEGVNVGLAIDIGASSVPIYRTDDVSDDWSSFRVTPDVVRDWSLLARVALVPSVRRGAVTLFGSAGLSTETTVPPVVTYDNGEDPGAEAGVGGVAAVIAAGAAVDLGRGVRLSARVGDAFSEQVRGNQYGPQVDVGLSIDVE